MPTPFTLVVTGGIAMGKSSTVVQLSNLLSSHRLFDADASVSQLLTEKAIGRKIAAEFGDSALSQDGSVNRPFLRDQVFDSVDRRAALENILHPEVRKRFEASLAEAGNSGADVFVADIPLFFESGSSYHHDLVLVIGSDRLSQFDRLVQRPGITPEMAEKMIAAQLPIDVKIAGASAVIWNSGTLKQLEFQTQFFNQWLKTKI